MIRMLVRDDDGVQILGAAVQAREAALDFLAGESAIEQHARRGRAARRLDEQCIALAAAAETGESHNELIID